MTPRLRYAVATLVTVAVVVLTPAAAMACRITNATPWQYPGFVDPGFEMYVWFDCGHNCGSYFKVEPGRYVNSTHGQGGHVQACAYRGEDGNGADLYFRESGSVYLSGDGEGRLKFPSTDGRPDAFHWDVYSAGNDLVKSVDHEYTFASEELGTTWCWSGIA